MDKKKLTVGFSLVLLSGLAAVSSTYAWFITNRTAQISFTDATIRNRSGNLNVKYIKSFNTMIAAEDVDKFGEPIIDLTVDKNVEDAKFVTDISGNGLEFFKTSWSGIKNTINTRLAGESRYKAGEINEVIIEKEGDADGYFIDFTLEISRDNKSSDHGLLVYLGEGTRILPKVEALSDFSDTLDKDNVVIKTAYENYLEQQMRNINAVKSVRLAVNDLDDYVPPVEDEDEEDVENSSELPGEGETEDEEEEIVKPEPVNKFIYAQEREIYKEVVMPEGKRQDGEYMGLVAHKDDKGAPIPGFSAYGLSGSHSLKDIEEVRDGFINVLGENDDPVGHVVSVAPDPNVGGDPTRYDFVSGFKSYQNFKQVSEELKDDDGVTLEDWEQPLNYGLIADLSTDDNTVEYVNFRMWIEGTDVNAIEDVVGGIFTLELDIYTVEVLKN